MSTPSWIGHKLSGRYEIEALLGQGGMSSVYKALDPNLRRTVAVKMIHPHLSTDANFVSRFEEEAASIAQLRHPNIVQVYDFANDGETYYMVMEFVPGETMQQHLARLQKADRRMPVEDVIRYVADICDALEYTHTRGLIHRDIKPANILLNLQGQAILMDFGIAKIVGGKQHTATGAVVGTALYMSPEVIRGESVDKRTDIYALGVTLFEALAGKPPFQADSAMSIMMMHVNDPLPDLRELSPDVPDALLEVVEKALAKDKNERYQSAAEFAQALRSIDLTQTAAAPTEAAVESKPDRLDSTMIEEEPAAIPPEGTIIEEPGTMPQETGTIAQKELATEARKAQSRRVPPAAAPPRASGGGRLGGVSLPVLIGGGIIGLIIIVGGIFLGVRALGPAEQAATATATATIEVPSPTVEVSTDTPTPTVTPTPEPTLTPTATDPAGPYVRINSIRIEDGIYLVEYETFGYTEALPGEHIHFYFNNIAPEQAGAGGTGPWYLWGGPRPFDGYKTSDRPADATQICALQANPNHTINLNTGNCVDLPSE